MEIVEERGKIKVADTRVSKKFDVWELVPDDLKDMFDFLQIDDTDDKYSLDRKINAEKKPTSLFFIPAGEEGLFRAQTVAGGGKQKEVKKGSDISGISEDMDEGSSDGAKSESEKASEKPESEAGSEKASEKAESEKPEED